MEFLRLDRLKTLMASTVLCIALVGCTVRAKPVLPEGCSIPTDAQKNSLMLRINPGIEANNDTVLYRGRLFAVVQLNDPVLGTSYQVLPPASSTAINNQRPFEDWLGIPRNNVDLTTHGSVELLAVCTTEELAAQVDSSLP